MRITADKLQLDGQLLADGGSAAGRNGAAGAGGGIYMSVTTLQGSGLMTSLDDWSWNAKRDPREAVTCKKLS